MAAKRYQYSGARLTALRKARGLTLDELSADVGKDRSTLWTYEKDRSSPSAVTLADLAHRLRVSPIYFFVEDGR